MKKKLLVIFSACFVLQMFAQTNKSVNLDDDVYKILDYARLKGYMQALPYQKPYTNEQIKNSLNMILDSAAEISDYERKIFSDAVLKIENINKKDETKNSVLHSRLSNKDDAKIPVTFVYDFSLSTFVSGGLYTKLDYSQFGFDVMPELDFSGDFSKYLSWNFNALGDFTRMPLIEIGDYYCGNDWYTGGEKKRTVKKFINTSYLPYNYNRPWDAKVYYISNLSTTGLEGWPQELSLALNMTGEIRASFFDNKLNFGFGRIYREIAGMDNGSSLVLNAKARPFVAFEMQASPFSFLRYTFMTGSLEYPSQKYLNENWCPDKTANDDSYYFQNNYTINMVDLDFKYLHIDFGSSVVWPNRFALGYIFPLANFVEYQNHLGDADNLQMFGDIKLKYQGLGEIWASLFLDELDLSTVIKKDAFTYTRDMYAYQVGLKYVVPKLPFATISLRYTKVEPYCYTHQAINYTPWFNHYISENYTNDFFISLTRNAVSYGAVFVFLGMRPNLIDAANDEKIRRAGIYIYNDHASALKNEKIAALAAAVNNQKPQKLSKKLVANLLHFVNASLETLKSLTGGNVEKTSHRVMECNIPSHDNLMGAMITFDGDISGGLVLIFNKDIVKEAAMMMLGEEVESDSDLVDVVSEFTNIIAGRSKALLSERNISINISLPKPYVNFKELYSLIVGKMGVQVDFLLNGKPLYIFLTY